MAQTIEVQLKAMISNVNTLEAALRKCSEAAGAFGDALVTANVALQPYGLRIDADKLASQFGVNRLAPSQPPGSAQGRRRVGKRNKKPSASRAQR